jgi:hypothetical protein
MINLLETFQNNGQKNNVCPLCHFREPRPFISEPNERQLEPEAEPEAESEPQPAEEKLEGMKMGLPDFDDYSMGGPKDEPSSGIVNTPQSASTPETTRHDPVTDMRTSCCDNEHAWICYLLT